MSVKGISFRKSGLFDSLILDFVEGKKTALEFAGLPMEADSILEKAKERAALPIDRQALVSSLKEAYSCKEKDFPLAMAQIERLAQANTFTVTTGHQLCLFTGPLYFIYKIFSVIKLAKLMEEKAKEKGLDYQFVPVYWMHTEDHDLAEINHFYLFGKKMEWQPLKNGMAGTISTQGLDKLFMELEALFGPSSLGLELASFFKRIYLENQNLTAATFQLANELFAEYGLVVLDPRATRLKAQFTSYLKHDIFQGQNAILVEATNRQLEEKGYKSVVNPREINVFYTGDGFRERLVKEGDDYMVLNSSYRFTKTELEAELDSHPERFSPNVVLRPMFQEYVLPNVAYVGGAGELAYWMQYRSMFQANGISYPVLWLRNSLVWIDQGVAARLSRLGLEPEDLFLGEERLVKQFVALNTNVLDLEEIKAGMRPWLDKAISSAAETDKSLEGAARAEVQKIINGLENLESKMIRSSKAKLETQINQIKKLKEKLFPKGFLHERQDNFSNFYLQYGKDWFTMVYNTIQPLEKEVQIWEDGEA
jgi:bacillithiol biosynthesis cysteine-adding enzyme BshC